MIWRFLRLVLWVLLVLVKLPKLFVDSCEKVAVRGC